MLLARTSLPILAAAERAGLDCRHILESAGITPQQLEVPQALVSTSQISRVWDLVVELSGDPWFSLRSAIGAPSLNAVDYILSSSQSLQHAVKTVNAYFTSTQAGLAFSLDTLSEGVAIRWNVVGFPVFPSRPGLEYGFGRIISMMKAGIGPRFRPLSIHFPWTAPADPTQMTDLLQCPLLFEQPAAGVMVAHSDASRTFYGTDSFLADAFAHETALALKSTTPDQATIERVRRALKLGITSGTVLTVDEVARKIGMSRRTLQRQLAGEQRSFISIVDEVRKEVALCLLERGPCSAQQLSDAVGFAGVTTFYRAYKRWTGQAFADVRASQPPLDD